MKLRSIDYVTIFCCALAAGLCYAGSNWSAPMFIISSSVGLTDSAKNKVLSGAIINGIFLALNIAVFVKNVR